MHASLPASGAPEKTTLRLGFVALTDCAPLLVAQRFAASAGLELQLLRQPSWAALRDKLLSGELDAAHALYGLAYGVQLGIGGPQADMAALMTLNQNGQAITLSPALAQQLRSGQSLRQIVDTSPRQLVFAQTFPTGTHAMWLYYWLAAQGVHPLSDVQSVVIAPSEMSATLASGRLDGFCAGEPWHAVAAQAGAGVTWIVSSEIWPEHPEKILACRRDFAALYPNSARALIRCVLQACRWLDADSMHRAEAARMLAQPQYLNQPEALILPRLLGQFPPRTDTPEPVRFFGNGAVTYPWLSDGAWFVSQYQRWGYIKRDIEPMTIAAGINQTALYRQAAAELGIACPDSDVRHSVLMDGTHWP
ncbi:CmpA/NrtA family ABC transporter substrate-binding protein [Silvimonas sp. JCM 19000]